MKKKKVAIITIIDLSNYGNRLQNYAVNEILNKRGFQPQTIKIVRCSKKDYLKNNIKKMVKEIPFIELEVQKIKSKIRIDKKRYVNFLIFSKKHLDTRYIYVYNDEQIKKKCKKYAYYAIGSDQIWNPQLKYAKDIDFADFAKPNQKVCFAPSFGISEIPEQYKSNIANCLKRISNISVREKVGANIIKELAGRDAEVIIDPTMLLSSEDWKKVEVKPNANLEKKYVFCYFLGKKTEEQKKKIAEIKKKYRLEEYSLMDKEMPDLYTAGPGEFISLIEHAELVCTDSFHASVFSILFKRPFLVFPRGGNGEGMSNRLDTLLETFHLEKRNIDKIQENEILECDFKESYEILEQERKRANEFLDLSLS